MTPEQELRSEMERIKGHAIRNGYGWKAAAAVGRLLNPIPEDTIDHAAKAIYRASFPEPAKDDGPWMLASDVVRARYRQMAEWAIEEDRAWLIGGDE